ncbi:zinc carboxypeptidase family protein (macronuclear) [Tetrahymena thermophila SB210]|uniref:Zinc carboxypeptidase family protein n=1 Tax=Tetrahymena thermophila (strain SB210) TaxID=312017 RepID=Q224B9_TETTS|nr:zinc carboxypeptidase family protein [Tetrahymena thermophila SB210]EAR80635.1 zinc carboxypeptidase family protein [Tetrahymena thermophila SB210]|eukprot:XP_001028298.1 zinc carboxypeptidase family protein [Tetrahymena thermophila SB210]
MINQALNLPLGKEQILNKYKEISQIETLKQILGSYQDQFENQEIKCRAFLSEIESKKEENTQQLQNLLEQCQRKNQLINIQKSMTIKQSIYTLIDSINFFPNDSNQFNQSNINPLNNQKLSSTQQIIELVSNKSNFCSQEFLEQLRVNLENLDAIFNQISFENMFQQNKQPIRFQELNNQKVEEINEYIDHLIKLYFCLNISSAKQIGSPRNFQQSRRI